MPTLFRNIYSLKMSKWQSAVNRRRIKRKGGKDKTVHIKLKIEQNPTKNRDELRKLGKLNISCSTIFYADIRKLNHSMNPWFDSFIVKQQLSIKEIPIGTTSSEISYQVGDMYST